MAGGTSSIGLMDGVARLFGEGSVTGLSEGQLLDRFLVRKDSVAFEALVARHGPMVLSVCRRVLRDHHAADDAFQATFLLLVRKAPSIRGTDLLGPWLHRVAYRVSVRAGKSQARRLLKEFSSDAIDSAASPEPPDAELGRVLHQALDGLPEKYRAPIVLCYLEGQTHDEAARRLKWPVGSVKGRLARAREILKGRLGRLGVAAPAGLIASGLMAEAKAAVPATLRDATVAAATRWATGEAIAAGTISAAGSILAEEAARAMATKKLGAIAAGLATLGMFAGGAAVLAKQDGGKPGDRPKADAAVILEKGAVPAPKQPDPVSIDDKNRLQIRASGPEEGTGGKLAEQLRSKADVLAQRRDQLLDQTDDDEMELEGLREKIREIRKKIAQQELAAEAQIEGQSDEAKQKSIKRWEDFIERHKQMLEVTTARMHSVNRRHRAALREVEEYEEAIADLRARADEAAKRPGKPNTMQIGDILIIEVLQALPGRPISGERIVRPDGTVSLGFYGDLEVVGLTRTEIKILVVKHLQKFLTDNVLGLISIDPRTEKEVRVSPADTNSVFVAEDSTYWPTRDPGPSEVVRRRKMLARPGVK